MVSTNEVKQNFQVKVLESQRDSKNLNSMYSFFIFHCIPFNNYILNSIVVHYQYYGTLNFSDILPHVYKHLSVLLGIFREKIAWVIKVSKRQKNRGHRIILCNYADIYFLKWSLCFLMFFSPQEFHKRTDMYYGIIVIIAQEHNSTIVH